MKGIITIIGGIIVISGLLTAVILGFVIYPRGINKPENTLSVLPQPQNDVIAKLQKEVSELKDMGVSLSVSIGGLREDWLVNGSRIAELDRKVKLLLSPGGNIDNTTVPTEGSSAGAGAQVKTPKETADYLQNKSGAEELFKNTEFIKMLQEQMENTIRTTQQKDKEAAMARSREYQQKRFQERIEKFAKENYCTEYQQQELSKILTETSEKLSKASVFVIPPGDDKDRKASFEEMRTKTEALKKESDLKIQGLLQPAQYEAYKKLNPPLLDPYINPYIQTTTSVLFEIK